MTVGLVFACSSSSDGDIGIEVTDLSLGEQSDLCEDYLDGVCADDPTICADPCIDTGCIPAADNGDIDANCGGVLDIDVLDCADGDLDACDVGGDCILDALDDACA
ncbi:MAG: hypothetical protein ABI867_44285 [Kofleriaceae bacterium]